MTSRLTDSLEFHGRALLLRAERQKVLAGNIANADTPRYAARDFDFRAALTAATGWTPPATGGATPSSSAPAVATPSTVSLATSRAGHLGGGAPGRIDSTATKYRTPDQPSLDGNSVDIDRERANFADNSIRYEAALRFVNGSVRTMLTAIKGE